MYHLTLQAVCNIYWVDDWCNHW